MSELFKEMCFLSGKLNDLIDNVEKIILGWKISSAK
jgi:hypothetical protein